MPINYKEYHPDWKAISKRIRTERAKNRCEWCSAPNKSFIYRWEDGTWESAHGVAVQYYKHDEDNVRNGYPEEWNNPFEILRHMRDNACDGDKITYIVLTVAHIDHDKTNNDDANLVALCQRCHLNHDRKQHAENRRNGRNWKRNQTALDL